MLFSCGRVILKQSEEWLVKACPTRSSREEPYQTTVIGKGGMGAKTLAALEKLGAVYFECHRRRGAVRCAQE